MSTNITAVNVAEAGRIMSANFVSAGIGTFLEGNPGIGKTSIAKQVFERLNKVIADDGKPLLEELFIFGTNEISPLDLGGLYHVDIQSGVTKRYPLQQVPMDKRVFIFIDELGDCPEHEQSGWYALALDHRLGTHKLKEGSLVCGATNPVGSTAAAREVSTALKDRVCWLQVRADYRCLIRYAIKNGWSERVVGFLMHMGPEVVDRGFDRNDPVCGSTPRGWERVSRLEKGNGLVKGLEMQQLAGNIGEAAASKYLAFRSIELPDPMLPFKDPKKAPLFDSGDPDDEAKKFAYLAAVYSKADPKKPSHLEALVNYFMRFDGPTAVFALSDLRPIFGEVMLVRSDAYAEAVVKYRELVIERK